jgi:hypothetical protein
MEPPKRIYLVMEVGVPCFTAGHEMKATSRSTIREIVLDTETTGLDPLNGHRVVEIGAVEDI